MNCRFRASFLAFAAAAYDRPRSALAISKGLSAKAASLCEGVALTHSAASIRMVASQTVRVKHLRTDLPTRKWCGLHQRLAKDRIDGQRHTA
jgi:hypothetical protein